MTTGKVVQLLVSFGMCAGTQLHYGGPEPYFARE